MSKDGRKLTGPGCQAGLVVKGKKGTDADSEISNLPIRRMLVCLSKITWLQGGVSVRSPMPPFR